MSTEEILNNVAEIESASESIPMILEALSLTHEQIMEVDTSAMDGEPDYAIEHVLEIALELANDDELEGVNLSKAEKLIAENWMTLEDIPGGTPREINVRAAEFLTAVSPKTGNIAYPISRPFSVETLSELISSEDWKSRYLGALIAREHFNDEASALLESLAEDPFEDEDGIFLVREAAGFADEE